MLQVIMAGVSVCLWINPSASHERLNRKRFTCFLVLKLLPNLTHIWWRHQMETFSALLAICARNSPVTGEFPAQRPVTRSFDVFFDLHLNERLSKQSCGCWFETPLRAWWRHCNEGPIMNSLVPGRLYFWNDCYISHGLMIKVDRA